MDPIVVRAVQRAVVAFVVTFVLGSGVVFAIDAVGGDGGDVASPTPSGDADGDGEGDVVATTPNAYLVWMPGGFPADVDAELTSLDRVRQVAVGTAGVGWLEASFDEDGEPVDEPDGAFRVPLEVTGVVPQRFATFLPKGEMRELIEGMRLDEVVLSASAAKLRGLGVGATLEFDPGAELEVVGVVPDVLVGGYEVVANRRAAENLGAGLPRYALLRLNEDANPNEERLMSDVEDLIGRAVREPDIEVRSPGETTLLRAHDRSPTPLELKRRFGEFAAIPASGAIDIADDWIDENIETREVPRLGPVLCHRKTLSALRKAMVEVPVDADLGDTGDCFDESWDPEDPQGTLPAWLWGASIRLSESLNRPGDPPLLDDRIVETMEAWGFRWAGEDAYSDGGLFELAELPSGTDGTASPSA